MLAMPAVVPARPSPSFVRLTATGARGALTVAVRSAPRARCRVSVAAGRARTTFPVLITDATGRGRIGWRASRNAPRGRWTLRARCRRARRSGARRVRTRVSIAGGNGKGPLVARSSTQVLRGTFESTGVRPGANSCAPAAHGAPVCFANDPLAAQAGQAAWYALGRRPDLAGLAAGRPGDWLTLAAGHVPVGTQPLAGAVAIWRPGSDGTDPLRGHVAYVSGTADFGRTVIVDEANWSPGRVTQGRRVPARRISGYLYPTAGDGGPGPAPGPPPVGPAPRTGAHLLLGDVNNDGREDLITVTPRRQSRPTGATYTVATSTGSAFADAVAWGGSDAVDVPGSRFEMGDFNGDGSEDLLVVGRRTDATPSGATYSVLTSTGSAFAAAATWGSSNTVDVPGARFEAGDLDNDGHDDLVVVTPRQPAGVDYSVLTSNGSALSAPSVWGSSPGADLARSQFLVADLTMEGRDDVIAVMPRRTTTPTGADYTVLTSTGTALAAAGVWSSNDSVDIPASRFGAADLTADDRADVLTITPHRASTPTGADYTVLTSTGTTLTARGAWNADDALDIPSARLLLGDATNDARADLVVVTRRRDAAPSGAAFSVLTSNGSALANPVSWGGADGVDLAPGEG